MSDISADQFREAAKTTNDFVRPLLLAAAEQREAAIVEIARLRAEVAAIGRHARQDESVWAKHIADLTAERDEAQATLAAIRAVLEASATPMSNLRAATPAELEQERQRVIAQLGNRQGASDE